MRSSIHLTQKQRLRKHASLTLEKIDGIWYIRTKYTRKKNIYIYVLFSLSAPYTPPRLSPRALRRWSGAGGADLNQDGFSDLLVGAFVVPGVFVMFGHDDDPRDNSTAVTLAIVSGVLGCLFCTVYEARVWVRSDLNTIVTLDEGSTKGQPINKSIGLMYALLVLSGS